MIANVQRRAHTQKNTLTVNSKPSQIFEGDSPRVLKVVSFAIRVSSVFVCVGFSLAFRVLLGARRALHAGHNHIDVRLQQRGQRLALRERDSVCRRRGKSRWDESRRENKMMLREKLAVVLPCFTKK
jgi:hypothetical protein